MDDVSRNGQSSTAMESGTVPVQAEAAAGGSPSPSIENRPPQEGCKEAKSPPSPIPAAPVLCQSQCTTRPLQRLIEEIE